MTAITVHLRRADGSIADRLVQFDELTVVDRWRDVGRWTLVTSDPQVVTFFADRAVGVVVKRGETVIMSGPVDYARREYRGGTTTLTVGGPDDTTHLAGTLAWPIPTAAITAQTDYASDFQRGTAEDLIVHYCRANLVTRLGLPLTIPTSEGRGNARAYRGRFQTLLEVCQTVTTGAPSLGFRLAQQSDRKVGLEVWEASDLTSQGALLSDETGTTLDFAYAEQWPTATRVIVGGGDERYERRLLQVTAGSNETTWDRIVETFHDERGIDGVTRTITSGVTATADGVVHSITTGLSGEAATNTFTTTANHELSVGDKLRFTDKNGGKGLVRDIFYWVKATPTNKTFRLSYDSDRNDQVDLSTDMTSGDLEVIENSARWSFTNEDHGLANGDEIRISRRNGGKGLALNSSYWVRDRTADTFRLSTRSDLSTLAQFDTDITSASIDVMDWDEADDEMTDKGQEVLLDNFPVVSLRLMVADAPGVEYGTDYRIGDLVRAYPSGVQVDDRITEATLTVTRDGGEQVQVWVGPKDDDPDERVERRARMFDRRLRQLERSY